MTDDMKTNGEEGEESLAHFHYIKSNFFRVIHADGAYGGASPRGGITIDFYSERSPIPRMTVQPVKNGDLGDEIKEERIIRDGIVREVEVAVQLSLVGAKALKEWLDRHIKTVEGLKEGASE